MGLAAEMRKEGTGFPTGKEKGGDRFEIPRQHPQKKRFFEEDENREEEFSKKSAQGRCDKKIVLRKKGFHEPPEGFVKKIAYLHPAFTSLIFSE